MDAYYTAALLACPGLGQVRLYRLQQQFGSSQEIWHAGVAGIADSGLFSKVELVNIGEYLSRVQPEKIINSCQIAGVKLMQLNQDGYPDYLINIHQPPLLLYYRGLLPVAGSGCLAVVGSRKCTGHGRETARRLSGELAAAGWTIVSGAARGIDTAAHEGALASGGKTVAVLGCGIDIAYPAANARLLLDIVASGGAVVSEYPPGTQPHPGFFPARNRIISGMSRAVVVVEAGARSGALITADLALEQGRDVFAVPGNIFAETSRGTNGLIKQGAKLLDCSADVINEYGIMNDNLVINTQFNLSVLEQLLLAYLQVDHAIEIDELAQLSAQPASVVMATVVQLLFKNLVQEHPGRRFSKKQ